MICQVPRPEAHPPWASGLRNRGATSVPLDTSFPPYPVLLTSTFPSPTRSFPQGAGFFFALGRLLVIGAIEIELAVEGGASPLQKLEMGARSGRDDFHREI